MACIWPVALAQTRKLAHPPLGKHMDREDSWRCNSKAAQAKVPVSRAVTGPREAPDALLMQLPLS